VAVGLLTIGAVLSFFGIRKPSVQRAGRDTNGPTAPKCAGT
jgi:hypothetical protein